MNRIEIPLASITGLQLDPNVALLLTVAFVLFLFRRDFRERPNVTGALWLPILWMFIIASRPVSQWLKVFGLSGFGGTSLEEGSPLDSSVYLALIVAGFYVLSKRQVSLSEIFRNNGWLMAFLLYCFIAIIWSDYPFVAFKRWTKILGHPIMVLIVFTEPDPEEALRRLMKRCAYVIVPVSILFVKYYRAIGCRVGEWGESTNTGIAQGKNMLGADCFILGLFFFWHLLQIWQTERGKARRKELWFTGGLLLITGYCLQMAHSSTSWIALLVGVLTMVVLGLRFVNKRFIGAYAVAAVLILVIAQLSFDIYGIIVDLTGHGGTIEGRGQLWQNLLETDSNPILGAGFESYWLGEQLQKLWDLPDYAHWKPDEAHNGYLEAYLNLGIVGLFILIGLILATFRKCSLELLKDFEWGRFRMALLVAIVAYNWTEAAFKGLHIVFVAFYLIAVNYPRLGTSPIARSFDATNSDEETELVHGRSGGGRTTLVENEALLSGSDQVYARE
jgi:exopolysaccharide production protein ExoQ